MKLLITNILFILALGVLSVNIQAQEDVDPLQLAELLIKNKNYARAAGVLGQIKDPHEVIPEKYWLLKGLLELKQKRFSEALTAFKSAQKEGAKNSQLYLGYAQAYLGLKKLEEGLEVLSKNKGILEKEVLFYQLQASLSFEANRPEMGWNSLQKGISQFPKSLPLIKQKWFYLVEQNLIEVSYEVAKTMANQYELSALDMARMGQKYRKIGDQDKAIAMGEMARLKDPRDEEIIKDLARSYVKKDNVTAAAQLFTMLSEHHPKYLVEASQLWRQAGYPVYAERLALEIRNPVEKIKQNLTLALLNEDFNRMTTLGQQAVRTPLKDDQDIRYALAYAHFMMGDYSKASVHLKQIQRGDLFKKAIALKEAMDSCESGENLCF